MKKYTVLFTKEAAKDVAKLSPKLKTKLRHVINETIAINPYLGKKLLGDLDGYFSLRLTYKDRIVYEINEQKRMIIIHRTRTHYGD